jgi:gluconate kinase
MIYLLYGQPGSGKTTLGKLLADHLETPFIIDGDEFRQMFTNVNYGREGREQNINSANAVATFLNKKEDWMCIYLRDKANSIRGLGVTKETDVVMCLVNPYVHLREQLKQNNEGQVVEILLTSDRDLRRDYHVRDFEIGTPDHYINTDISIDKTWESLKSCIAKES